jgi:hypothetical protein
MLKPLHCSFLASPRFVQLDAALLLKDTAQLAFEAAVGSLLRLADAEEAGRAVGSDLVAEAHAVLDVELHLVL